MGGAEVVEYLDQREGKLSCSPASEYGSRWAWVLLPGSPTDLPFSRPLVASSDVGRSR